ncbi:hypothetical protein [Actinacidiphila oryziradicis]|uniref:hypothetical protein n=1 Tax=Actinacidiphila oryziradicis TaxID=2571141 RepID=UPI00145F0973|nr:hypothetical protein [Actinacidiphila oryziradicis]
MSRTASSRRIVDDPVPGQRPPLGSAEPARTSAVRMFALIEDHDPHAPGAVLRDSRPWPAYAVAMVVATVDDAVGEAVSPDVVAHILGMRPSTAEGTPQTLTKAG